MITAGVIAAVGVGFFASYIAIVHQVGYVSSGGYLLIFGVILDVSKGIPDYPAFLVTGVFVFNFTQRAFISTSNVITDSLPLIRALQFPRASLPLAYVMIELQQMLLTMTVLAIILLGQGMIWLGALGASIGFGVQQAMQMLGGQSVGFISGEWRDVPRGPVLTMIVAIVLLILAAVIMAYGNSLAH